MSQAKPAFGVSTLQSVSESISCPLPRPNSFVEFRPDQIDQSIPARFEDIVEIHAERPAVKHADRTLSYTQLNRRANALARRIVDARGVVNEPIGILLPQGIELIVAIMAVLKSGKAYVGLDAATSKERLAGVLTDLQIGTVIANDNSANLAARLGVGVIDSWAAEEAVQKDDGDNLSISISSLTPAYIFYTSGSTGRPKGVFDSHRNVLHNIMRYTNALYINSNDRLTLLQTSSYSGSVSSLFCALLNGGCVLPFDVQRNSWAQLARWTRSENITIFHSVPAIFRGMLSQKDRYPNVRVIRLEGDRASRRDADLFRHHFGAGCYLVNGLGTTETGLVSQFFVARDSAVADGNLPVGFAARDMEVLIMDEDSQPCRPGQVGEISVRSRFLALGYWHDPERTAQTFIADRSDPELRIYMTGDLGRLRPDGVLEHLGRKTGQATIRGRTIVFAEIESAMQSVDSVADVVVGLTKSRDGNQELVACYIAATSPPPTVGALRRTLSENLHAEEIPSVFVAVSALPQRENGKVDRLALPRLCTRRPTLDVEYVASQSLVQLQLLQIWERVLHIDGIGIRDSFFELGGHSLLALNMLVKVEQTFGVQIDGSALLVGDTVEKLAVIILQKAPHFSAPIVAVQSGRLATPLFYFHGDYSSGGLYCLELARHLDDSVPFYVLSPVDPSAANLPNSYGAMADRYLELLREVQPKGPYRLSGTCNGGMVAYEIAHRLIEQGETVDVLALFAASADNIRFRPLHKLVSKIGLLLGYSKEQRSAVFLRLREMAVNLASHKGSAKFAYFGRKFTRLPVEAMRVLRPPNKPPYLPDEERDISKHFRQIDASYMPPKYPGHVTLIWPTDEAQSGDEAAETWRGLARGVELRTVSSTHLACLTDEIDVLAGELNRCYCRSQS